MEEEDPGLITSVFAPPVTPKCLPHRVPRPDATSRHADRPMCFTPVFDPKCFAPRAVAPIELPAGCCSEGVDPGG